MAPNARPRSSTSVSTVSNRPRPISRASTTSVNTAAESYNAISHGSQSGCAQEEPAIRLRLHQMSPEEMISHSENQLKNPNLFNSANPSIHQHPPHSRAMSVDTAYSGSYEATRPPIPPCYSCDGTQNTAILSANESTSQIDPSKEGTQRKSKSNAATQANDLELKRLFQENRHRDLKDVAASVLANERGPKAEKTKQIFAMNWLSLSCKKSTTSVPRNRVYAQYAQRCGTERVPLLNPASFGKLVRIIFPDITTRRLGMRGESKYHYVDLALESDEPDSNFTNDFPLQANSRGQSVEPTSVRQHPDHAYTADFPSPQATFQALSPPNVDSSPYLEAQGRLYLDRAVVGKHKGPSRENMIGRQLRFPNEGDGELLEEKSLELPDIRAYLPVGTDPDTAGALRALYRSHCVSIIDCVRYCKEKQFWQHLTSFHGTLTVPVQKLFSHPNLAAWIQECDWLMYQKMIHFVSPLALQVMPEVVTNTFQSISDNLGSQILTVFGSHPSHVREAKHGPAAVFSSLLGRLLRVNAASHAAAHILGNDMTREQMWQDWVHHVKPAIVVESCLPGAGYSRCIQILTKDLHNLLSPLPVTSYSGMQQIYADAADDMGQEPSSFNDLDDSSTSSVLDRWITFLHGLPSKFPQADARTLLHCVSDVGTACLRDITMATAISFGQWTVTKVWVDEMMLWLAEKGGFTENGPRTAEMRPKKRSADTAGLNSDTEKHISRRKLEVTDIPLPGRRQSSANTDRKGPLNYQADIHSQASIIQPFHDSSSVSIRRSPQKPPSEELLVRPPPYYPPAPPPPLAAPTWYPDHDRQKSTVHTQQDHGHMFEHHENPPKAVLPAKQPDSANVPPQTAIHRDKSYEEVNDDSGIGLDIELPRQHTPIRITDYGGFIASNTASDPTDVVVC